MHEVGCHSFNHSGYFIKAILYFRRVHKTHTKHLYLNFPFFLLYSNFNNNRNEIFVKIKIQVYYSILLVEESSSDTFTGNGTCVHYYFKLYVLHWLFPTIVIQKFSERNSKIVYYYQVLYARRLSRNITFRT